MANKWVNLEILTYTISKLKLLINGKADKIHKHNATDVTEDTTHKFVTNAEKAKINTLVTDGEGNKIYHDDGTFKELVNANTIDDSTTSPSKTYSSKKIQAELDKKAKTTDLHTHHNKNVLDDISLERFGKWDEKTSKIITTGKGNKFHADDGNYYEITGGTGVSDWSELINKPFDDISYLTMMKVYVDNPDGTKTYKLASKRIKLTKKEYDELVAEELIDDNMIYIITDDNDGSDSSGSSGTGSDHTHPNLAILNGITLEKVAEWDTSAKINDVVQAENSTYSSNRIENRLNEVQNNIVTGQNGLAKMWQKTYLNKLTNDTLYVTTTDDFTIDKSIVQVYKFVEGESNIVEVLKTFNNTDADNFYYNKDGTVFDGVMKIKDAFSLNKSLNSAGYYETDIINKEEFMELFGIEVIYND